MTLFRKSFMYRRLWPVLALIVIVGLGCSREPVRNAEPVQVTGSVKLKGAAVTGVVLNLQPTAPGAHPVSTPVTDGVFSALMTPGRYCYFITEGKSPAAIRAVPKEYLRPDIELRDEIVVEASSPTVEIDME